MFDFINICRALSDENRVRILMALRGRALCVCQVTAFLDLAPSTTSKHLSTLRQARLIDAHKQGRWVYYTLSEKRGQAALAFVQNSLESDPLILEDEARIAEVLCAEQAEALTGHEQYHSLELHTLAHEQDIEELDIKEQEKDADGENISTTPTGTPAEKRSALPSPNTTKRSKEKLSPKGGRHAQH